MESNRFWRQLNLCPPDKLVFPINDTGDMVAGLVILLVVFAVLRPVCSPRVVVPPDPNEELAKVAREAIEMGATADYGHPALRRHCQIALLRPAGAARTKSGPPIRDQFLLWVAPTVSGRSKAARGLSRP